MTSTASPQTTALNIASRRHVAVIGLGYVGLPVAVAFSKVTEVIGFDVNQTRIAELQRYEDRTNEITSDVLQAASKLLITADASQLHKANFFIITVPTPIDNANVPDFTALKAASATVGKFLKAGDVVVYESTVYPGATEEVCLPILQQHSGLVVGRDFGLGYSPERINPGDKTHSFTSIKKIVSGFDAASLQVIQAMYAAVVTAGVFVAGSIKVAEAAKVIENTQRDVNIALINELALLFDRLEIPTHEVLEAAGTKWNFLPFRPGLVGGHCIGVDPYYLTHKAESVGYNPQMILAGRRINNGMGAFIVNKLLQQLIAQKQNPVTTKVAILGLTFKENCPDVRNSKVFDIVQALRQLGMPLTLVDPLALASEVAAMYGETLTPIEQLGEVDVLIFAVGHSVFQAESSQMIQQSLPRGGIIIDLKWIVPLEFGRRTEYCLWRL
jgi:UDP-N-acetyl-D-galactosamine dehydrogenase